MPTAQTSRLAELEAVIEVNHIDFYALGQALRTIKEERLYRLHYSCFEDYLQARWDMKRAQAYRLIAAAQVMDRLSPIGDTLPTHEAQVRELAKVDARRQAQVWQAFLKAGLTPGAQALRAFIAQHSPAPRPPESQWHTFKNKISTIFI